MLDQGGLRDKRVWAKQKTMDWKLRQTSPETLWRLKCKILRNCSVDPRKKCKNVLQ